MSTAILSLFRQNIIQALRDTATDKDLRKELHKLLSEKVEKETPFLMKPKDKSKPH